MIDSMEDALAVLRSLHVAKEVMSRMVTEDIPEDTKTLMNADLEIITRILNKVLAN